MGRIPVFEASIGGRASQAPTISLSTLAPLEHASKELGDTFNKVTSEVGDKWMEAQRTNTIIDEKNKMMDKFFGLQDEAKKQDPDKQVQWFHDQANAYREDIRSRVTDQKTYKAIEESWLSHTETGLYRVRDDFRKKVAADGIAKAMDGDDAFMKQVYSMYDNPTLLEMGLKDRKDTYDALVKSGHLNAAQAQQYKEQLTHQVVEGRAGFYVEKSPYKALDMLNNPQEFVDLSPAKRSAYINRAQSEIKQDEARKRMEEREKRMEVRAYLGGELMPMAGRVMDDTVKSNATSPEFKSTYQELSRYRGFSPTVDRILGKMENVGEQVSTVMDVKTLPSTDLRTRINDYNARWENLDTADREKARTMMGVLDNQEKRFKKGQHLEYMDEYHLNGGITPIAMNTDIHAIARRQAQVEYAKETFGGNPNVLLDSEADTFAKAWKEGDESARQRIGSILFRLAGGTDKGAANPSKVETIAKQMHIKEGSIVDEVQFMLQGDNKAASILGEGRKRLENNPERYGPTDGTLRREINKKIDDLHLGAIDPNDTMRKQWTQGIRNMYAGSVGETLDSIDSSKLDEAVSRYFGPIVEVNGHKSLAWADGEDSSGHTQIWRSFTPDLMKQANGMELPKVREGTTLRDIPFSEVVRKGMLMQEDGKYVLMMPNKAMPWNQTEFVKAVNSKGKPYTVDIEAVLPDLKRRREQLYAPYGDPNALVGP